MVARKFTIRLPAYLLWPVVALWPAEAWAARDTTTVVSASGPVQIAQQIAIQATVSYATTVTTAIYPGGTVDFTSNGTAIAGCTGLPLNPSQGFGASIATCNATFSQAGAFAIRANYPGDANSNPSSGSSSLTVVSPTGVALALKSGYPQIGQAVSLAATVSSTGNLSPTGTVNFTSNGAAIPGCTNVPLAPPGTVASCITSFSQTGTFTLAAAYSGDSSNNPSTGSMQLAIGKAYAVPYIASYVLGAQSGGQYYASQAVTIGAKFAQAPSVAPPSGTATFYNGATPLATVAVSASTCDLSGYACASVVAPGAIPSFPPGTYSITASYSGDANYQSATTAPLSIGIGKTPTTPYLTSNPDGTKTPLVAAQPLTLGAEFPPPPGSVVGPSGSVTFYDGSSALATVAIDSNGHAVLLMPSASVGAIAPGTHAFKAVYGGDTNYQTSDTSTVAGGVLNVTVNQAPVALVLAASPFHPGQPVSIAAVPIVSSPGILAALGTFDFSMAGASIGGCSGLTTLNSSGTQQGYAQCTATLAQAGTVNVTYKGDASTANTSAAITLASGKALPGIYAESVNPTPVLGETVTVDVRLLGPQGFAAPTGTVTFTDGATPNRSLGSAAVGADGHALLVLASGVLALGGHNINAAYSGDANYTSGTALPLLITVEPDPTVLVVASPPAQLGQPLNLNAAVAVISPGTAVPTGPVDFYTSTGAVAATCNPAPQNGTAQCTARIAALDTLSPTVLYMGDNNTAGSTVAPALSSTHALAGIYLNASSPNPPFGTPVAITAVLIAAPGLSVPTGTVIFQDNGAALASVAVSGGSAILAMPSFAMGSHLVTAIYSGDANYQASPVAASVNIVVTKAVAKMDLCSVVPQIGCTTAVQIGEPATLQANVTVLGPGTPLTMGTVDFSNGGTSIAGCTGVQLQNGIAQCSTTFPQPGTYTIGASYSGFASTTSVTASMQLSVGKLVPGFYVSAYSTTLPYGAGVGIRALLMGTPLPTGTVAFSDGASVLATVAVGADGTAPLAIPSGTLAPLSVGTHSIVASYSGDANYQASGAAALSIVVTKAAVTVALASTPAQLNQPATLKAAVVVAAPGVATPAGTVDFTNNGNAIAGCTGLALQAGAALCTTTFTQLGTVTIAARYSGDAVTASGSASMPLTAGKAVAGIYMASSPTALVYGQTVTVRALLLGAAGVPAPTGNVTFSDGAAVMGAAAVGADGHASLSLAAGALAAGAHTFAASYGGDANYAGATVASLVLTVSKASTSTTLAAPFGSPFTAAIGVLAPGAGSPTGAVQFFMGGSLVGSAPVVSKGGSFTAAIPAGSWSGGAWAVYQGDTNFAGSASVQVAVAPAAVVSIASDHNPATAGQPVTFTVAVTPAAGNIAPIGSVQLSIDGASFGSAPLVSGAAGFAAASAGMAVGSHTITAGYSGDAVYPSASATLLQVVTRSIASLTLSSSIAATVYGQPVTFSARVAAASGTVQFSDASTAIGSAPIVSGTAALTLSTLAAGTHSISALCAGDAGTGAASSTPLPFTVSKAQTATLLGSSGSMLTATVAAIAPGAGTPSGTVKFLDASNNSLFSSPALTGGTAIASQPATADAIVAVYSGDANFAASASAALTPLAAANAASFAADSFAPDEIVTLFGTNLSATTVASTANPAPSLGGATASVTDSTGVRRAANLMFVSPAQASMVMPAAAPAGAAVIAITNAAGTTFSTAVSMAAVAPGLFTADGSGKGAPVGQTIRVHPDSSQDAPQDLAAGPIDLGGATDAVYLLLYGTGLRHQTTATAAFACSTCTSGDLPLAFAGAQPSIAGLDQVNLLLPQSLRGAGPVTLVLTVDGVTSNPVTLVFR